MIRIDAVNDFDSRTSELNQLTTTSNTKQLKAQRRGISANAHMNSAIPADLSGKNKDGCTEPMYLRGSVVHKKQWFFKVIFGVTAVVVINVTKLVRRIAIEAIVVIKK